MTKSNRSWIYFGVSTAALAVSAVLVGMNNHPTSTTPKPVESVAANAFSSAVLNAKDTLSSELNRRFTDRQNIDFGMSRVIRTGARFHYGPTMDVHKDYSKENTRKVNGKYEYKVEGEWIGREDRKPLMSAENDSERMAIQTLRDADVDVAIYTVGKFEADKGEKPGPALKQPYDKFVHYTDFQWGIGDGFRAKGPAYITQKAEIAPRAFEVVDFGRKAWASGEKDFVQEGKDGWVFFAHRVDAPDMSCARCHGDVKTREGTTKGAVQKAGDPTGLFVIALRKV